MEDQHEGDRPSGPIFRWGDPTTATDGELVTMYGDDDLVPASHFGLQIINDGRSGALELVAPLNEIEVSLDLVWVTRKVSRRLTLQISQPFPAKHSSETTLQRRRHGLTVPTKLSVTIELPPPTLAATPRCAFALHGGSAG